MSNTDFYLPLKSCAGNERSRTFEDTFLFIKTLQKAIYGTVLLCKHKQKNVARAVKILKKSLMDRKYSCDNLPVYECAETEIEILEEMRKCPSPYVLSLAPANEQFENEKMKYVTTPFCEEGELFAKCSQGCLPPNQVITIFGKIMQGVHHLHTLGYVHNDVSLENILLKKSVDGGYDPVLCDFGLCSRIGQVVVKKGKVQYQAPEVIFGDVVASPSHPKSDVYSLGVVLFILIFKYPPYDCPHPKDARYAHIQAGKMHELLSLWKVLHLASPQLISLLQSMLSEEPSNRPTLREIMALPMFGCSVEVDDSEEFLDIEDDNMDILFDDGENQDMVDHDIETDVIINTPEKRIKEDKSILGTSPDSTFGISLMQNRASS